MELSYREVKREEAEALSDWLSSDTWPFFLGHTPTKREILERIADGDFFGDGELNFWILTSDQNAIGLIELYQLDDLAPMFSVRLRSDARGKGLGEPIIEWLTRYIFDHFPDKRRIEAQTREDNIPMRKVFNRAGYVKEAYYRMASPTEDGGRVASVAYGILREDWMTGGTTQVRWAADSFFDGDII